MGGRAAAHRGGVGEGLRLGSRAPARGADSRGARPNPPPHLANLGGDALRPAPVGAYPAGASAYGAEQMLGDVWEWTIVAAAAVARLHADDLRPVLRSRSSTATTGCCAAGRGRSAPSILRPSFRNWDHPIRRQIFSGVRLAWDV